AWWRCQLGRQERRDGDARRRGARLLFTCRALGAGRGQDRSVERQEQPWSDTPQDGSGSSKEEQFVFGATTAGAGVRASDRQQRQIGAIAPSVTENAATGVERCCARRAGGVVSSRFTTPTRGACFLRRVL